MSFCYFNLIEHFFHISHNRIIFLPETQKDTDKTVGQVRSLLQNADQGVMFLKSLYIYIFKLVNVRNTHAVFSCGLNFSLGLMYYVLAIGIYRRLNEWVTYFVNNLNNNYFLKNRARSSFVISYSIISLKKSSYHDSNSFN